MKKTEQGFLLLTSHLGDPESKPLTVAQFRELRARVAAMKRPRDNREMTAEDLCSIGYGKEGAERILQLLSRTEQLCYYVNQAGRYDCYPITAISELYPGILRQKLGQDCPGCLWAKGDSGLLSRRAISLVGSRDLLPENENFAKEVGRQAALQGYVLISGNARGADRTAQDSCLSYGGQVISIVADSLEKYKDTPGVLYLSEDGWNCGFSSIRALSRNRLIHTMGEVTLVAQCSLGRGGTWSGTQQNLRHRYSPVFCFQDGSKSAQTLTDMGAEAVDVYDLSDFSALQGQIPSLFE